MEEKIIEASQQPDGTEEIHGEENIIEIRGLGKSFKTGGDDFVALDQIDLNIRKGSIQGIIGLSGAGKSTLVRCINYLEKPSSGQIFFQGKSLGAMRQREILAMRQNMGMIFQQFNLFASRTVYDNVSFPLKGSNLTKEQKDKKVRDLLKLVELEEKASAYPSQLSGGQKQRVAIARALANDPEIILSDESTSALDPRTTRAILDLLKKVNRELGITIVVITHEMQVIKDICDRVAVMKDGRVVETGTVFDIFANPKEQITREFVENTSNMSRIYELVETKSPVVELKPGEAILRFRYLERNVSEALVSQLSRKFDLDLNIIFGSIELIGENPIGGLVVIAQGTSDNINQAIQYLKDKNVGVEVILDGRTA